VQIEAHLAKTDAALLATVVAAQGALAGIYRRRCAGEPAPAALAAAFWIAQGVGILIKGPITPIVGAMTVLALAIADRDWRGWPGALRIGWGLPLALGLALPWLVAVQVATGGGFLAEAVGHDMLGKVAGGQEEHGAPLGYYLVLLFATFWPGSLFLAAAARWGWRHRAGLAERFLLAWMLPTWVLFECVPTKLPHYVLPTYPALALLAGRALAAGLEYSLSPRGSVAELPRPLAGEGRGEGRQPISSDRNVSANTNSPHHGPLTQGEREDSRMAARFDLAIAVLWAAVTLALGGAALALPFIFGTTGGVTPAGVLASGAALAIMVVGVRDAFLGRQGPRTAALVIAGSALFSGAVFHSVLPPLDRLWLSRDAAALVASAGKMTDGAVADSGGKPVDSVGYTEPSLVFLLGTATRFVGPEQAAADLGAGRSALALVADRDEPAFRAALHAGGIAARPVGSVAGLNYSNARRMTLTLYSIPESGGRE
jgi:4-amino-4-deoxy-L-arabinose transferase-like glycosyltransferase